MIIDKKEVVKIAKTYVGTPFHHLGRVKGHGIDCVGIILCVAKELGIKLIIHDEFQNYGRRTRQRPLVDYMDEQFICLQKREIGSIAVSWYNRRTKEPSHLGIVTNVGMVHTNGHLKVVIEEHWSPKWAFRIVGYYKYPGVE